MSLKGIANFFVTLKAFAAFLKAFVIITGVIESLKGIAGLVVTLKVISVSETLKVIATALEPLAAAPAAAAAAARDDVPRVLGEARLRLDV